MAEIELTKMRLSPSHDLPRTQRNLNLYSLARNPRYYWYVHIYMSQVRQRYLGPVLLLLAKVVYIETTSRVERDHTTIELEALEQTKHA